MINSWLPFPSQIPLSLARPNHCIYVTIPLHTSTKVFREELSKDITLRRVCDYIECDVHTKSCDH